VETRRAHPTTFMNAFTQTLGDRQMLWQ